MLVRIFKFPFIMHVLALCHLAAQHTARECICDGLELRPCTKNNKNEVSYLETTTNYA